MNESLTTQERIERGHIAQRLLEDPVLNEAIAEARQEAIDRWLGSQGDDMHTALVARATVQAIELMQDALRRKVSDAVMAAEQKRRS